jgi:hypothetical protein
MGTQATTTKNNLPEQTPEQKRILALLAERSEAIAGQFGDLSSLADGNLQQLAPQVLADIEASQASQKIGVQRRFESDARDAQTQASASGIAGSSSEAVQQAFGRQTRNDQLAQIDSEAAAQRLQRPMDIANLQLNTAGVLGSLLSGATGGSLAALSNERTAGATQTSTTKGSAFSTALQFGQQLAGSGAFAAGGAFGSKKEETA